MEDIIIEVDLNKKFCARCKIEKSFEELVKHKNKVNGIGPYCRPCACIITKASKDKNRDAILAARKERRKDPEVKAKEKAYARKRYEKISSEFPNKFNEHQKTWIKANPEKAMLNWVVQVISSKANTMKNNSTFDEMVLLGKWAKEQINRGGCFAK